MRQASLLIIALLFAVAAHAKKPTDPLKDAPPAYRDAMIAAMRAFTERNFDTARAEVMKADSSWRQTPVSLNILGAILIEERKFEEGRKMCHDALKLDAAFFPARFNLAEIPFVQGKYAEARAMFEKLQESEPSDDLLRFRIFLTCLLEKNELDAKTKLDEIPLINDTPISFYANAAWEFTHGREKEGKDWIASGLRTFPPIKHINFIEVFYDLGWLKREPIDKPAGSEVKAAEAPAK